MPFESQKVYSLIRPDAEKAIPVLIDSPHSGRTIPDDANFIVTESEHPFYEDRDVDTFIAGLEHNGMTRLSAAFSRCYIDPNRAIDDIEDDILSHVWTGLTPCNPTRKAEQGFGLIRRLGLEGERLQLSLTTQDVEERIAGYYTPYHEAVDHELNRLRQSFGHAVYINMHSMPSRSAPILPTALPYTQQRVDVIVSDCDGVTANKEVRNQLVEQLRSHGFCVLVNELYKGGELISRHGQPTRDIHALQVEVNRALYLDEETYQRSNGYRDCLSRIQKSVIQAYKHL